MSWDSSEDPNWNASVSANLPAIKIVYIKKLDGVYNTEVHEYEVDSDMTLRELALKIIRDTGYSNISLKGDSRLLFPSSDGDRMISEFNVLEVNVSVTAG